MTTPIATTELDEQTKEELRSQCEIVTYRTVGKVLGIVPVGTKKRCELTAEWIIRSTCHCGNVCIDLICDPHNDIRTLGPGFVLQCSRCGCVTSDPVCTAERL